MHLPWEKVGHVRMLLHGYRLDILVSDCLGH